MTESLEARRLLAVLTSGQRLEEAIGVLGETDVHTFEANAGDAISMVVGATGGSGFSPVFRILAPNAAPLTGFAGATDLVNVAQTGTYSVEVVDFGNNNTGTYALSFFRAPATQMVDADSGPISSGQRLAGSIDAGDMDVYTFQVVAGAAVSAVVDDVSGASFSPVLRVYGPDGAALSGFAGSVDLLNVAQPGTYYIIVRDFGSDNTGGYAISFFAAPAVQQVDADSGPISSGQRLIGSVDRGDIDIYTFQASAGDAVSAVVDDISGASFSPVLRIFGPAGAALTGFAGSADLPTLAQGGLYYMQVRDFGDDNFGTYAVSLFRTTPTQQTDLDSGPISSGQRLHGSIDRGDIDIYTFQANAGEAVSAVVDDTSGASFSPVLRIFRPDGVAVTGFAGSADLLTLAQTGTYYLQVRDFGDDNFGTYALSLFRTTSTQQTDADSGPISSNQRRVGSIERGDIDIFTFQADAGDSLEIVLGDTDGTAFAPVFRVHGPSGVALGGFVDAVDLLNVTQSGTYYVQVRDFGDDNFGGYALSIAKAPAAQQTDSLDNDGGALASGQTTSGAITAGDLDVYTISLAAGAAVSIQMTDLLATSFVARIDLFNPNGVRLSTQTGGTTATINLASAPLTGTYYIVARESGDDAQGNYSIGIDVVPGPDTRPPEVTRSLFLFDAPRQQILFTLNESVAGSLAASDLTLQNLTQGQPIPAANITPTFNPLSNDVVFEFPAYPFGALPDGNYSATLNAGSLVDTAGNPLVGSTNIQFFVFAGDANRDRVVDIADFSIVASRFNLPGVFSQGDFDYSGMTEIGDFAILAAKFNTSLPAPAGTPRGMSGLATSLQTPTFGESAIDRLLDLA